MSGETFGQVIRRRREREGWSQWELARRAKLDQKAISDVENDKGNRRASTVERLAEAFGQAESYPWLVLAGVVKPPPEPPARPAGDRAFTPDMIVEYVEAHPDERFHATLMEMREELAREDYVALCLDTYAAWTSNGNLAVNVAKRGLGRG